jgi:hyperosmotically inducible periplasmic protein
MKTIIFIFFSFLIISFNSGCTIYKAAVDERDVGTIADDTTIKAKIFKRFVGDDVVKALDITTTSYKGYVHLIGEYNDSAQKVRAIELAKGVEGVKGVTPYFLAKQENGECGTTRNLELTTKVKAKLINDNEIWSTNVNVKTMQCIVVLWGTVGKQDEILRSINHAKSVEGVKTVRSFLKSVR